MKKEVNFIDYGIYIDHNHSYIISLNNSRHEHPIENEVQEIKGSHTNDSKANDSHATNHNNEMNKKFYKVIVEKIKNANNILIFGPSETKYELQKEIIQTKYLKDIKEEISVTDRMHGEEALRFTKNYYMAGNQ